MIWTEYFQVDYRFYQSEGALNMKLASDLETAGTHEISRDWRFITCSINAELV